jgi:hypothetical protein
VFVTGNRSTRIPELSWLHRLSIHPVQAGTSGAIPVRPSTDPKPHRNVTRGYENFTAISRTP